MFSDETMIELQPPLSQFVRRSWNEPISDVHLNQKAKHPLKLMFWGCMSSQGMGRLHLVEGSMNADQYLEVLRRRVLPQADDWFEGADWIFQQDLAPCHTAKKVKSFFDDQELEVLKWPGNSPDLSPIENLWAFLKQRFRKLGVRTKPEAIRWFLNAAHRSEDVRNVCENLIDSMPKRIKMCIDAKGGHINF